MNPGRRRFQRWIFTEENPPNMPEYRGLFDETISRGAGNKETNGEFWRSRGRSGTLSARAFFFSALKEPSCEPAKSA